jgi:hypothetical protein
LRKPYPEAAILLDLFTMRLPNSVHFTKDLTSKDRPSMDRPIKDRPIKAPVFNPTIRKKDRVYLNQTKKSDKPTKCQKSH